MPEISGDLLRPLDDCIANIAQEQGLELADVVPDGYHPEFGVQLLVGADHYWDIMTGSVKRVNERLVAVETVFGWTLQGTGTTSSAATYLTSAGMMQVSVNTEPDDVSRQLRPFWELEHLGIVDDEETAEHAPAKYFCQTKESFDDQYKPCTHLSSRTNQPAADKDDQE
ncbi:hypothetical protein MTO96_001194 [Rhipicephalus appendiculatus]